MSHSLVSTLIPVVAADPSSDSETDDSENDGLGHRTYEETSTLLMQYDTPASTSQVKESGDHELGDVASEVPHDHLIAPTSLSDNGSAPLYPESHELGAVASEVPHDRLTFWLTDEQVEEEKVRSLQPWHRLGGYLSLYDTSGIDPKYGDHDYLIEVFLQSTFFRARSNKKIGVDRLRKKWASFVQDIEHRINTLGEERRKYEDSSQGFNFKLHHMCLSERIPCAATLDHCEVCGRESRHFDKSMVWRPEFDQLSQELRDLIAGSDDEIGMMIREAAAAAKDISEMEEKPIVKFVFKHMSAITSDLNEWVGEIQDTLSTSVDVEESLNILQDEVGDLRNEFDEERRSRDEVMENAVRDEVSEWMEIVRDSVDDAVADRVEILSKKITAIAKQQILAARDIAEIKEMLSILVKRKYSE